MRLELLPDRDGYSYRASQPVVLENALPGGMSARRLDMLGATNLFAVQFTVSKERFLSKLKPFLDAYFDAPDWFDILLISEPFAADYHLRNHRAQIIPGSLQLTQVSGHRYVLSAQLEAYLDDPQPTSKPYAQVGDDRFSVAGQLVQSRVWPSEVMKNERFSVSSVPSTGERRVLLRSYNDASAERFAAGASVPTTGARDTQLLVYDDGLAERFAVGGSTPVSGARDVQLIIYENSATERFAVGGSVPTQGTRS